MPRAAAPTATPYDEETIKAILRRASENSPALRGARDVARPGNLSAVRATKSPVPVRAVRLFWRTRALHGPLTCPLAAYAVAGGMYDHRGGQDFAVWAVTIGVGQAAAAFHRIHRRRAGRPLLFVQWLWEQAVIGTTGVYLAVASVINPAGGGMDVFLGVLAAGPGIAWWARNHTPVPALAPVEPENEPEGVTTEPEPDLPAKLRAAWARGIAATGGAIPDSAVADVRENPDRLGGGVSVDVILSASGGVVRHTPGHVIAAKPLIHQTFLRVIPNLHPANLVFDPHADGTVTISLLERNPLSRTRNATPGKPGTFTHVLARTAADEDATITLWVKGRGGRHRCVVGSTGSGKSGVMNMLIGLDGHTRTADGRPLVAPVVLDPHGGVSYAQWREEITADGGGEVRLRDRITIAGTTEDIHATLASVCATIEQRIDLLKQLRVDQLVPSPEHPMVHVYADEIITLIRKAAAAGAPVLDMLGRITNEGRKTNVLLTVGTLAFSEEALGSTVLLDALASCLMILHSTAASTGLKVNTGMWDAAVDPRRITTEFADGTPAGGTGYWLRGEQPPMSVRYDWGEGLSDTAEFPAWRLDATAAPAPTESRPAAAVTAPVPARGTAWEQARDLLAQAGGAMTLDQLHKGTGIGKSALANGLSRAAESGDVAALPGRGGWVLPQYASLADLTFAGVNA